MSGTAEIGPRTAPPRRCRPRPIPTDGLRPTDVIGVFFLAGLAMIVAGGVIGVANAVDQWAWGRWLALHLVFVGGISQLILGASQFFAGAFLATDPPRRGLIRFQAAGWNVGVVTIAVAVPLGSSVATYLGAVLLVAVLAAYAAGFVEMRRRSLGHVPWASRWYLAAALFLAVGVAAGVMLATGVRWSHGNLLGAHMALNVGGWFGAAIVGTLHTFYPSLTGSRLRFPRLQLPTFVAWILGIGALVVGYGFSVDAVAVSGWALLLAAATLLAANLVGSLAAAPRPLSLPARIVGCAQLFLPAGLLVAFAAAAADGSAEALVGGTRAAVGTLLIAGWVGLTVSGSLLHLLAVLIRVRDLRRGLPLPCPRWDAALSTLATVAVAAVAAVELAEAGALETPAKSLLILAYGVLAGRIAILGGKVVAGARPQI